MSIIQSFIGTNLMISGGGSALPDPGGWFNLVDNAVNGSLRWKIYDDYHNENVNVSGLGLLQDDTSGSPYLATGEDFRSYMFTGYVMLPGTDNYIFRSTSDDGSYVWIGTNAWAGNYNIGNALINNGGLHGSVSVDSQLITMTGNVWYPIRILFGNAQGGTFLSFQYSSDGINFLTPDYANNSQTAEGFN